MTTPPWLGVPAAFPAAVVAAVPLAALASWVETGWRPVRRIDLAVAAGLHEWVSGVPVMIFWLKILDLALHPWVFRAGIAVLVVLLARRHARLLAWWAGLTMAAGSLLGVLLKFAFARARPFFEVPVGLAPGYSFPSGHALNSVVAILVILIVMLPAARRRWIRWTAWLGGALVVLAAGFDRVALGVHYVSDVIGAWLAGIALVASTVAVFQHRYGAFGNRVDPPRGGSVRR